MLALLIIDLKTSMPLLNRQYDGNEFKEVSQCMNVYSFKVLHVYVHNVCSILKFYGFHSIFHSFSCLFQLLVSSQVFSSFVIASLRSCYKMIPRQVQHYGKSMQKGLFPHLMISSCYRYVPLYMNLCLV